MANVNPPKKHKYPVSGTNASSKKLTLATKAEVFFRTQKKLITIIGCAIVAAAILITALVMTLNFIIIDTPYNDVRFADHIMIPDYFNMTLSQAKIDEKFESEKKIMLRNKASYKTLTSGKIKEGHNVTISTEGFVLTSDGKEQQYLGATLKDYEITDIGSHVTDQGTSFSEELQEAIIGTSVNSTKKIIKEITYPDDYANTDIQGKTLKYYITVSKVTETIYPEYTDEIVSIVTTFDTVAEYENYMLNEIKRTLLWNSIIEGCIIKEYPEDKINMYKQEYDDYYNQYMNDNKLTFNELLGELNTTAETYNKMRQTYAEGTVKEELVLYFIIKTENVRVSRAEDKYYAEYLADANGYKTVDELKTSLGELYERTIIWEKVKDMILNSATIVE